MENKTVPETLEIPRLLEYDGYDGDARDYYAKYYTENAELRAILDEESWVLDVLIEKINEINPTDRVYFMRDVEKDSIVAFNRAMRGRDKDALVRILAAQLERTRFWLTVSSKWIPASVDVLTPIPKITDTDLTPRAYMFRYFFENPEWGTRLPTSYRKMTEFTNAYLSAAPDLQESLPYYLGESPKDGCLPWEPFIANLNSISGSHRESSLCVILESMAEYCARKTMGPTPGVMSSPNIGAQKYAAMVRGAASEDMLPFDPWYCEFARRDEEYEASMKRSMDAEPGCWSNNLSEMRLQYEADKNVENNLMYLTANGFHYLGVDMQVDWFVELVNKYREWICTDETRYGVDINLSNASLDKMQKRLMATALSYVMLKDPDDLFDTEGELRPYCKEGNGPRISITEVERQLKESGVLTSAGVNVALVEKRLAGYL